MTTTTTATTKNKIHTEKSDSATKHNFSFQLKGRLFTLSVLQLQNLDTKQLDKELSEKIKLLEPHLTNLHSGLLLR